MKYCKFCGKEIAEKSSCDCEEALKYIKLKNKLTLILPVAGMIAVLLSVIIGIV